MENVLRVHNLKNTRNRKLILDIIAKSALPISAEDIYNQCIKVVGANINLSTIYRTLNTLEKSGLLIKQLRNDKVAYYQENKHSHKHLFICNSCGKSTVLDNCPLKLLIEDLSRVYDFTILTHNIEFYGICKNCKKLS